MADLLFKQPLKATDANDDPVAGALAYFYETGTSTPVTVYQDDGAVTPHATPVVANANGVFDPIYVDGADGVKVDLTDPLGTSLDGFPYDAVYPEGSASTGASAVTFLPTTTLPVTNVNDAINLAETHVSVSATDTTPSVLNSKITVSGDLAKAVVSPGANETIDISYTAPAITHPVRGWVEVEEMYTGATVASVTSSQFEDDYEYGFSVERVTCSSSGARLQIEAYNASLGYVGPSNLSTATDSTGDDVVGWSEMIGTRATTPLKTLKYWTTEDADLSTGNDVATVSNTSATSQLGVIWFNFADPSQVDHVRFSFTAGNMNGGVIKVYKMYVGTQGGP